MSATGWKQRVDRPPSEGRSGGGATLCVSGTRKAAERLMRAGGEPHQANHSRLVSERSHNPESWQLRDGDPQPLVDTFLAYSTRTSASALGDLKAMERREAAIRYKTKTEMDTCADRIRDVARKWSAAEKLFAAKPGDLRALQQELGASKANSIVQLETLDRWHTAHKAKDGLAGQEHDIQEADEMLDAREQVLSGVEQERAAESARVKELEELNGVMNRQLADLRAQVHGLKVQIDESQGTSMQMVEQWKTLTKDLRFELENAESAINKAVRAKQQQETLVKQTEKELVRVEEQRHSKMVEHEREMELMQAQLERTQTQHQQQLVKDQEVHDERLATMREEMERISHGGALPEIDVDELTKQAMELVAKDENLKEDMLVSKERMHKLVREGKQSLFPAVSAAQI